MDRKELLGVRKLVARQYQVELEDMCLYTRDAYACGLIDKAEYEALVDAGYVWHPHEWKRAKHVDSPA